MQLCECITFTHTFIAVAGRSVDLVAANKLRHSCALRRNWISFRDPVSRPSRVDVVMVAVGNKVVRAAYLCVVSMCGPWFSQTVYPGTRHYSWRATDAAGECRMTAAGWLTSRRDDWRNICPCNTDWPACAASERIDHHGNTHAVRCDLLSDPRLREDIRKTAD